MPLNKAPLTEKEIETLTKWIKEGAEWVDHWAYVPPKEQKVPPSTHSWINNSIDHLNM